MEIEKARAIVGVAKAIRDEMQDAGGVYYHTGAAGKIARVIAQARADERAKVIEEAARALGDFDQVKVDDRTPAEIVRALGDKS